MTAGPHAAERHRRLGVGHVVEDALAVLEEGPPSKVSVSLRVAQHQPDAERSSSASSRRPTMAGVTLSHARCREAAARCRGDKGRDLLEVIHALILYIL